MSKTFVFNNFKKKFLTGQVPPSGTWRFYPTKETFEEISDGRVKLEYFDTKNDIDNYIVRNNKENYLLNHEVIRHKYEKVLSLGVTQENEPYFINKSNFDDFVKHFRIDSEEQYEEVENEGEIKSVNFRLEELKYVAKELGGFFYITSELEYEYFVNYVNTIDNRANGVFGFNLKNYTIRNVICPNESRPYNGVLSGNGYRLQNVTIECSEANNGLVGVLGKYGVVRNFELINTVDVVNLNCTKKITLKHIKNDGRDINAALLVGKNYGVVSQIKAKYLNNFSFKGFVPEVYSVTNKADDHRYLVRPKFDYKKENYYYLNSFCINSPGNICPYVGYFNEGLLAQEGTDRLWTTDVNNKASDSLYEDDEEKGYFWNNLAVNGSYYVDGYGIDLPTDRKDFSDIFSIKSLLDNNYTLFTYEDDLVKSIHYTPLNFLSKYEFSDLDRIHFLSDLVFINDIHIDDPVFGNKYEFLSMRDNTYFQYYRIGLSSEEIENMEHSKKVMEDHRYLFRIAKRRTYIPISYEPDVDGIWTVRLSEGNKKIINYNANLIYSYLGDNTDKWHFNVPRNLVNIPFRPSPTSRQAYYISPIVGSNYGEINAVAIKFTAKNDGNFVGFIGGLAGRNVRGTVVHSIVNMNNSITRSGDKFEDGWKIAYKNSPVLSENVFKKVNGIYNGGEEHLDVPSGLNTMFETLYLDDDNVDYNKITDDVIVYELSPIVVAGGMFGKIVPSNCNEYNIRGVYTGNEDFGQEPRAENFQKGTVIDGCSAIFNVENYDHKRDVYDNFGSFAGMFEHETSEVYKPNTENELNTKIKIYNSIFYSDNIKEIGLIKDIQTEINSITSFVRASYDAKNTHVSGVNLNITFPFDIPYAYRAQDTNDHDTQNFGYNSIGSIAKEGGIFSGLQTPIHDSKKIEYYFQFHFPKTKDGSFKGYYDNLRVYNDDDNVSNVSYSEVKFINPVGKTNTIIDGDYVTLLNKMRNQAMANTNVYMSYTPSRIWEEVSLFGYNHSTEPFSMWKENKDNMRDYISILKTASYQRFKNISSTEGLVWEPDTEEYYYNNPRFKYTTRSLGGETFIHTEDENPFIQEPITDFNDIINGRDCYEYYSSPDSVLRFPEKGNENSEPYFLYTYKSESVSSTKEYFEHKVKFIYDDNTMGYKITDGFSGVSGNNGLVYDGTYLTMGYEASPAYIKDQLIDNFGEFELSGVSAKDKFDGLLITDSDGNNIAYLSNEYPVELNGNAWCKKLPSGMLLEIK